MGRIPLLSPFVTQDPGKIQLSVRKLGAKLAMDSPFSACRSSGSVSHISWCVLPQLSVHHWTRCPEEAWKGDGRLLLVSLLSNSWDMSCACSFQSSCGKLSLVGHSQLLFPQAFWKGCKQRQEYLNRQKVFTGNVDSIVKVSIVSGQTDGLAVTVLLCPESRRQSC